MSAPDDESLAAPRCAADRKTGTGHDRLAVSPADQTAAMGASAAGRRAGDKAIHFSPSRLKQPVPQPLKIWILQFLSACRARPRANPSRRLPPFRTQLRSRFRNRLACSRTIRSAGLQPMHQRFRIPEDPRPSGLRNREDARRVQTSFARSGLFDENTMLRMRATSPNWIPPSTTWSLASTSASRPRTVSILSSTAIAIPSTEP